MKLLGLAAGLLSAVLGAMYSPARAGEADVVGVEATRISPGVWRFDVTVRHVDEGWDHYADRWEVISRGGAVLATRVLLHPHVGEQPFTHSRHSSNDIRLGSKCYIVLVERHRFNGHLATLLLIGGSDLMYCATALRSAPLRWLSPSSIVSAMRPSAAS